MARKLTIIGLIGLFCLAGCSKSARVVSPTPQLEKRQDVRLAMIARLKSEELPALRSAEIWENEYGPGLKLTTDHYEIYTTLLEPLMLRSVPGFIEAAYWGYNDQLPAPIETMSRFTVFLFADRQQWEEFTRSFAGDQAPVFCKIKTGAYYLNGVCVLYDIGRKRTLSAIGHEGWHQFNSRHFKYRLPSWLDEGIAMLFEASTYENGVLTFDPSMNYQRLGTLERILDSTERIPLRELIATSPGEVLATNQAETVLAFYCQSYALVRFLRENGYGKRSTRYHRLLWDGFLGEWPLDETTGRAAEDRNVPRTIQWNRAVGPQLFERYVGDDIERLEREYLAYCRRILHSRAVAQADEIARPTVNPERSY